MSSLEPGRTYSVVEYLANKIQVGSSIARVAGTVRAYSETDCRVGFEPQSVTFDAQDLPEPDRIALIESNTKDKPLREAIVTIDFATGRAKNIEFTA